MPVQKKRVGPSLQQVNDFIAHWEAIHVGFERAIRALPESALDFRPKPRMRTLSQVISHTLEAESYYFFRLLKSGKSGPSIPKKFKLKRDLLSVMRAVHKLSLAYLRRMSDEDLDRMSRLPGGAKVSARQVLLYAIAHEVHHRAQFNTYVRLWEPSGKKFVRPWYLVEGKEI